METYLFKLILCSSVLIGFYYLILERQKAHGFKRFYLLSGIVFSILIPFMSITYRVVKEVSAELVVVNEQGQISTSVSVENTIFTFENIIYSTNVELIFK